VRVQPQLGLVVLDEEALRQKHRTVFIKRDVAGHGHGSAVHKARIAHQTYSDIALLGVKKETILNNMH
jgi:hypothetical protein